MKIIKKFHFAKFIYTIFSLGFLGYFETAYSITPLDPLLESRASYEEIAKVATKIEIEKMCGKYTAYYFEGYTSAGSYTSWCCVFLDVAGTKTLVKASRGNCYHAVNQEMIENFCSVKKN